MYHQAALVKESIEGLCIRPGGVYVDATLGGGSHTRAILQSLTNGKLIAFDQDSDALSNAPVDTQLQVIHGNFRYLDRYLHYLEIETIDGLVADLGVSSYQFDTPDRGFSFRFESELDMRMNTGSEKTAADILNSYSGEDLANIFREYGEMYDGGKIATIIERGRKIKPIKKSEELLSLIKQNIPAHQEHKYLARLFQALRIEVNDEINALRDLLQSATNMLCPGGRIAMITYHSLEDRLVKNFFKTGHFEGIETTDLFGNVIAPLVPVTRKPMTPDETSIQLNNRIRSAKLRIAERKDGERIAK